MNEENMRRRIVRIALVAAVAGSPLLSVCEAAAATCIDAHDIHSSDGDDYSFQLKGGGRIVVNYYLGSVIGVHIVSDPNPNTGAVTRSPVIDGNYELASGSVVQVSSGGSSVVFPSTIVSTDGGFREIRNPDWYERSGTAPSVTMPTSGLPAECTPPQ